MRAKAQVLSIVVSSVVLAQLTSADTAPEPLATAGAAAVAGMSRVFDALDPAARKLLAPALVSSITGLRDGAIERGVDEIPAAIRRALSGYVPLDVLENARWRIDDSAVPAQQALLRMAGTPAMTLDHVVVFADTEGASDPALWAHELFHVMQYRDWGVEGFVERYLADYSAVEHDAAEFRWQWMKANGRVPSP